MSEKPIASSVVETSPAEADDVRPSRPTPVADLVATGDDASTAEEPASILLVDDRPENLEALAAILEPLGQRLVCAGSGDEALRELETGDFAAILLDVRMPAMDGFETARRIKARERSRHTPILFLTAVAGEEMHVLRGYEVGAVDYLAKPLRPDVLLSKVAVFVELHRAGARLARQARLQRDSERSRADEAFRSQAVSLAATTAKLTALNAELQRRQAELQHAIAARNRFYASMSHELRTPINAIIGYGTLLLDHVYGPLSERQRQGLERSHRAATHLLELVNDVLDLSKIEAGKIELALQPVAFPALVDELFVTVRPMADDHGSTLTLAGDCDASITTDPRRVRQIVLNLLSNAIKFGQGRPIEVLCAALPDGGVEIAVTDHGEGIPTDDVARIFDEFVQLPNTAPRLQGTGLGLPISQRLARLLGGDLVAESTVGQGSTFRLRLPAVAALDGDPSDAASGA